MKAATIDGCNMFQTFFLIVLPLLKGIMATVAVINVMWIWNDFLLPSLIINKNGMQTLPLRTYLFFGQFTKKWDLATAALVLCYDSNCDLLPELPKTYCKRNYSRSW